MAQDSFETDEIAEMFDELQTLDTAELSIVEMRSEEDMQAEQEARWDEEEADRQAELEAHYAEIERNTGSWMKGPHRVTDLTENGNAWGLPS